MWIDVSFIENDLTLFCMTKKVKNRWFVSSVSLRDLPTITVKTRIVSNTTTEKGSD